MTGHRIVKFSPYFEEPMKDKFYDYNGMLYIRKEHSGVMPAQNQSAKQQSLHIQTKI